MALPCGASGGLWEWLPTVGVEGVVAYRHDRETGAVGCFMFP